jgi:hypothetical protein
LFKKTTVFPSLIEEIMKIINRVSLILLFFIFCSCSLLPTSKETIIRGARIDVPHPPKPVGIKGKEGVTPEKFEIVEPPLVANPYQYWRAYKDGAIIWKPKDWRTIDDYIKNSVNWSNLVLEQLKNHNTLFSEDVKDNNKKSWYQLWK